MPYSASWDETAPVGSTTQASDIDLVFRNLKRDLRERLNEIFVDWTVDPVVQKSLPRVSAYHNTTQTITTVEAALAFNSERYDNSSVHDLITNNSRLTVPAGQGGLYLINFTALWNTFTASVVTLKVKKNGVTDLWVDNSLIPGHPGPKLVLMEELVASDYIEILASIAAGTAVLEGGNTKIRFEMTRKQ